VPDPVISNEVVYRRHAQDGLDELVDPGNPAIGKEYGLGIGIEAFDVADPVVLLSSAGKFVFLDPPVIIFLIFATPDQTALRPSVHGQSVEIKGTLDILDEDFFLTKLPEVFPAFFVNFGRIGIRVLGQIDFGLDYPKKGVRVSLCFFFCFF
jgi:hypothetical protein